MKITQASSFLSRASLNFSVIFRFICLEAVNTSLGSLDVSDRFNPLSIKVFNLGLNQIEDVVCGNSEIGYI